MGVNDNLPPGVSVSDLPGFRPQDEAAERVADDVHDRVARDPEALIEYVVNNDLDAAGGRAYEGWSPEHEADRWWVELPGKLFCPACETQETERVDGEAIWLCSSCEAQFGIPDTVDAGPFDSEHEAISYLVAVAEDELAEAMVEEEIEAAQDDYDW